MRARARESPQMRAALLLTRRQPLVNLSIGSFLSIKELLQRRYEHKTPQG